ncbi:MAG: type IX secretion system sortase PorU [Bacteroidales bacterium]|nr:type IX secretion system sortase PorU [Bacteroidales bacterium]
MKNSIYTLFFLTVFSCCPDGFTSAPARQVLWTEEVSIEWNTDPAKKNIHYPADPGMGFSGAWAEPYSGLPLFSKSFPVAGNFTEVEVAIVDPVFEKCTPPENDFLLQHDHIGFEIHPKGSVLYSRGRPIVHVSFVPIRKAEDKGFEKLISCRLIVSGTIMAKHPVQNAGNKYAGHSVLRTGDWYKLQVEESGIYIITYTDLKSFGVDVDNTDPRNLSLYGNGGRMLPEGNDQPRLDDLTENAIMVAGEEDGIFDEDDYILFYGQSPHRWFYVILGYFDYENHFYSDYTYYFLTVSETPGKRIQTVQSPSGNPTHTVTTFDGRIAFDEDRINLIESGKVWYADSYFEKLEYQYPFYLPGLSDNSEIYFRFDFAGRSDESTMFEIRINDVLTDTIPITPVNLASQTYARTKKRSLTIGSGTGNQINVNIRYLRPDLKSEGWLNYIILNYRQILRFVDGQLLFRDLESTGSGHIAEFALMGAHTGTRVWDITNPLHPRQMQGNLEGGTFRFRAGSDSLKEYIGFNGNPYLTPEFITRIENQDLHGTGPADMVIITHPLFREAAGEVASIHRQYDGMTVFITEPEIIYNEFSSGAQDVTAIRDFMKMLYDRHGAASPRYLLLFGDGSFDMKNRLENNTNFIPTYQTMESWNTANSYVIDDYFGMLDENEGNECFGVLDLGIGRIPAGSVNDADIAVKKIREYMFGEESEGLWKKTICLIGDDEDSNLHFDQADSLARNLERLHAGFNITKIYLDAFEQVKTTGGNKYPEVTKAINDQMGEGAFIINYIGHGGPRGWAHERVIEIPDIKKWSNNNRLPVFLTATCEFTRFDEPLIVSGGEEVFFNPSGGGIALFTTTRLAYSSSNFSLNKLFYERVFEAIDSGLPRLGDLIRLSKPEGVSTTRNFMLLGDPALRMSYPDYLVKTTHINGIEVSGQIDTLSALRTMTFRGEISDSLGNRIENFNGLIYTTVFDKATEYKTRANDSGSNEAEFNLFDKEIFRGISSVENGSFDFSFVVPSGVSTAPGNAKISYYAVSDSLNRDASGYYSEVKAGGFYHNPDPDNEGPEIVLYMNDESFVSGGITDENPVLIAYLSDLHGINCYGNSIGHDIMAALDEDSGAKMILNDYFVPDTDSYQSGRIVFPFTGLADGLHTLSLKAWDTYNNSSVSVIEFRIDNASSVEILKVFNYPNPFSGNTSFTFSHNKPGDRLRTRLDVFDLSGRLVFSDVSEHSADPVLSGLVFLTWNGHSSTGRRLESGAYVYKLRVTGDDGHVEETTQKLLISR